MGPDFPDAPRITWVIKSRVEGILHVEWQMKQKLAPLLFAEKDREGAAKERQNIVSPAVPSKAGRKKASFHRNDTDLPLQTFGRLSKIWERMSGT
jgi:hypothetical protein